MATHEITKRHASGGIFTDTETVLTYTDDALSVAVTVKQVPGLVYWSQPAPALMRKWVDELLKGTGMERAGKRIEGSAYGRAWHFTYFVVKAA